MSLIFPFSGIKNLQFKLIFKKMLILLIYKYSFSLLSKKKQFSAIEQIKMPNLLEESSYLVSVRVRKDRIFNNFLRVTQFCHRVY